MFILMTLFLIIGIGLIGYSLLKWAAYNRLMFRDGVAMQKVMVVACIGIILILTALFSLF